MGTPSSFAVFALPFAAALAGGLVACSGGEASPAPAVATDAGPAVDGTKPATCTIQAPTACPSPAPTYKDVAPILESRCASCHSGVPGGPWPLRDYEHVVDWSEAIRGEILGCTMPPPDAGVPITSTEKVALLTWIRCGSPP